MKPAGYCNYCCSAPCKCGSNELTDGERSALAFANSETPKKPKPKGSGKKVYGRVVPHTVTRGGFGVSRNY